MNILITGGYGLIGRNLVAELSKNNSFKIFLISRSKKAHQLEVSLLTVASRCRVRGGSAGACPQSSKPA